MAERILFCEKTACAFDNLRYCMRELFYWAIAEGYRPTHVLAGRKALARYEGLANQGDPAITYFKCIPIVTDSTVPLDEMRFMQDGNVIGRLMRIS